MSDVINMITAIEKSINDGWMTAEEIAEAHMVPLSWVVSVCQMVVSVSQIEVAMDLIRDLDIEFHLTGTSQAIQKPAIMRPLVIEMLNTVEKEHGFSAQEFLAVFRTIVETIQKIRV